MRKLTDYYLKSIAYFVASSATNMQFAQSGIDDLRHFGESLMRALQETGNDDFRNTVVSFYKSWGLESD